jgi:hypothetical protein
MLAHLSRLPGAAAFERRIARSSLRFPSDDSAEKGCVRARPLGFRADLAKRSHELRRLRRVRHRRPACGGDDEVALRGCARWATLR